MIKFSVLMIGIAIIGFYVYEWTHSQYLRIQKLESQLKQLVGPHPQCVDDDPEEVRCSCLFPLSFRISTYTQQLITCPICGAPSTDFPGDFCAKHKYMIEHHSHEGDDDDAIEGELQDFCNDGKNVVISKSNLESDLVGSVVSANKAIRRCGFVYLDSLYESDVVANWTKSFREFMKRENGGGDWRYPCQGIGRSEVMLPFEEPFNETSIYGNIHLRSILAHAFKGTFKMELQTVITSSPGSGNQRWHQGWRYLFDQNERRQKYSYAIIVGVVLEDLTEEMGPTEFCAGYNVKFYDGLRCPEKPVAAAMSSGGAYLFDYSVLHRGPGNRDPFKNRSVLMLAFSRNWFMNGGALINRGRPLIQTVHQRRYWEQWAAHPHDPEQYFLSVRRNDETWGEDNTRNKIHDQS